MLLQLRTGVTDPTNHPSAFVLLSVQLQTQAEATLHMGFFQPSWSSNSVRDKKLDFNSILVYGVATSPTLALFISSWHP